jgi:hypothetical protein
VERVRPSLILLSTSTLEGAERLIAATDALTDRPPDAVPAADTGTRRATTDPGTPEATPLIGFGGQVFVNDPSLRPRVRGAYLGSDAEDAIAAVEGLFDGGRL